MISISKLFVRIFSISLAIVFLVISILGIVVCARTSYSTIGAGVIVFGVVGIAVAMAGFCGAGYEKLPETEPEGKSVKVLFRIFSLFILCLDKGILPGNFFCGNDYFGCCAFNIWGCMHIFAKICVFNWDP
jgi:uncharacterized membrane protein YwaF